MNQSALLDYLAITPREQLNGAMVAYLANQPVNMTSKQAAPYQLEK